MTVPPWHVAHEHALYVQGQLAQEEGAVAGLPGKRWPCHGNPHVPQLYHDHALCDHGSDVGRNVQNGLAPHNCSTFPDAWGVAHNPLVPLSSFCLCPCPCPESDPAPWAQDQEPVLSWCPWHVLQVWSPATGADALM